MLDLFHTLGQLVVVLSDLVVEIIRLGGQWALLIAWIAWWLLAVNWKKTWQNLAQGAWLPVVLLMILGAMTWSQLAPSDCGCLGFVKVPNFWWQMGAVGLLAAVTFFCGWLQGLLGWTPADINLDPPAHGHDHGEHHSHGHS